MIKITQKSHSTDTKLLQAAESGWDSLLSRKDLGFLRLPLQSEMAQACSKRATEINSNFDCLVVIGIGGSSLGGKVIQHAFGDPQKLMFWENIDEIGLNKNFNRLSDLPKVHWLIISKSGKTMETLSIANWVAQKYKNQGLDFVQNCTAISEVESNPLSEWAKANDVPFLEIAKDVGGRFSVLSPVGMLPAAYAGVDPLDIFKGAQWVLTQKELVCEFVAQHLMSWERNQWISPFWVYCEDFLLFTKWVEQIWAESLGKPNARTTTPVASAGPMDQHSVLQQIMEGQKDKFVTFFNLNAKDGDKIKKSIFTDKLIEGKALNELFSAEATATQEALNKNGVSTITLTFNDTKPETLGGLFMFMELCVGVLGEVMQINAFDQPGVEIGKKLTREKMK